MPTGAALWFHLKLRFGLAKLPLFPVRYRLRTPGLPDEHFRWTRVIPAMDPAGGAFDFDLYGWDVRELRFLRRFVSPGCVFLDVGAHHGLYAVLAARLAGPRGRVLAFEPAPALCRRLRWHLRLNGCVGAQAQSRAVGAEPSTATFHLPRRGIDTLGSLRPPALGDGRLRRIGVEVTTLDRVAAEAGLAAVDLVKIDVEGAESAVLDGASRVLREHRPLWIVEVLDSTSSAWGGCGRDLVARLASLGHALFEFEEDGRIRPHRPRESYPLTSDCNLLAVPLEKQPAVAACRSA